VVNFEYENMFPFPSIRPQQSEAIDFCLKNFINSEKKFCIIEAATGVGKSAIGLTIARYINSLNTPGDYYEKGSYFLTTQKILQEQYVSDFPSVVSLKSASNYKCKYHKKNSCSESQQLLRAEDKTSKFFKACSYGCIYKERKQKFIDSSESITNFPYFLTETNYSGKIKPRELLVIDEGHNIESVLSSFVEVSISEYFSKNVLKMRFPQKMTQHQTFLWIRDEYLPESKRRLKHYEASIEKFGGEKIRERLKDFKSLTSQFDLLRSHVGKLKKFVKLYNSENWVFETSYTEKKGFRKITFKPIDVSTYADDVLFKMGRKIIIMSATIMNHDIFTRTLGINSENSCFVSLASPFPKENRPVMISPVGSMSTKNIEKTLPKLSQAVKEILDHHKDEKGIIHCKTYKIANYIKNYLRDSRILVHDSQNRDAILEKHIKSKKPTVLLSPSMTEGVDLAGESSRFQIICKVPYPYLGDKLIRKRMNSIKGWYELQTAKSIVQSIGRSVRSEEDHAVTYILDSDFDRFIDRNRKLFSKDFLSCVV
jgi:ATP-dependent DNA helicase DinG